jgi:ferredoxin
VTYRYLLNGETLKLDASRCTGCGRCVEVCPHAVFALDDHRARLVDRGACMECGACMRNCPSSAISVKAGVGCAAAVISGLVRGTAPSCGCDAGEKTGACGGSKTCC